MIVSKSSKGAVWLLFSQLSFQGQVFALMIADLNRVEQSGYFLLQGASGVLFGLLAIWQVRELLHAMNASNTNGTYYGDN
jgi:hypothetical protein